MVGGVNDAERILDPPVLARRRAIGAHTTHTHTHVVRSFPAHVVPAIHVSESLPPLMVMTSTQPGPDPLYIIWIHSAFSSALGALGLITFFSAFIARQCHLFVLHDDVGGASRAYGHVFAIRVHDVAEAHSAASPKPAS